MQLSASARWAACLLVFSVTLWGQGQGGGGNSNSGSGNSSGSGATGGNQRGQTQNQGSVNDRNTQTTDPFRNQGNDPFAQQMRPLYISGRVVTSEGLPPSEPVVIKRYCNGSGYPEDYTDSKGRFSFQVGGDVSMMTTDASVSGNRVGSGLMGNVGNVPCMRQIGIGRYDLTASTLRAELPGYRSDDLQLGMYSAMGNNDVGVITMHRLDGLKGDTVSALTLQAPRPALKAYESGLREMRKKKPNIKKALGQFDKAVTAYPRFSAAWAAMGEARMQANDREGAWEALSKSVEHDPTYLKPYEPLIQLATARQDWQSLDSLGGAYLELNPNATSVRFLTAVAALNSGRSERAEEMVLAIQARDDASNFPQTHQIMGMIHEKRADFEKAAGAYRSFVGASLEPESRNVKEVQRKLHEWQMLGVISKPDLP